MTETRGSGGRVVAFARPALALKRRAQELRRQGQRVEAAELLHMALCQEDTPQTRFDLAELMLEMGNLPLARQMAYQLCAETEVPRGAYVLLSRIAYAMGDYDVATDALYHDLHQDSESPESDDTRDLLSEWSMEQEGHADFRMPGLRERAAQAMANGDLALGRRRMKRSVRLTPNKSEALLFCATLEADRGDLERALRLCSRSLRKHAESLRPRLLLCCILQRMGKVRAARGFLRQIKLDHADFQQDCSMLQTADRLQDYVFMKHYAQERLKRMEGSILLLHALADACWLLGERKLAHQAWERILRIDPDDVRAASLFRWPLQTRRNFRAGSFPPVEDVQRAITALVMAREAGQGAAELLAPDAPLRPWLKWMLDASNEMMQRLALEVICTNRDEAACKALRSIMVDPDTTEYTRSAALMHLVDWDETGPFAYLTRGRLTEASCRAEDTGNRKSLGSTFMFMLLTETRRYGKSREIAELAAQVWRRLPEKDRQKAAGEHSYVWVKAMEMLYLLRTGQAEQAFRLDKQLPVSRRRISRVLRKIARETGVQWNLEGEDNSNEVH